MRWLATAVVAVFLTGCAGGTPLVDRVSRGQVMGDQEQVSIAGGRLDALPLAIAHCARFGRSAQWDHADGDRSIYRCVTQHP